MNIAEDSPVHSSSTSSDDFAAFLDAELDASSDIPSDTEVVEKEDEGPSDDDYDSDFERIKRRKIEGGESSGEQLIMSANVDQPQASVSLPENDICTHPGTIGGMCILCGQKLDDEQSGVAFGYIHKNLRLADKEIARLRDKDLKSLFRDKKLCLVLDLDHTLLNSTRLSDISEEERYLTVPKDDLPDSLKGSLHRLDYIHMMTKLRPYVHSFLSEVSKLFEMYIYTMGERPYALEMAKLLDPQGIYFSSRVIAQGDSTKRHQKALDIVIGQESAVLILDDTESVWGKHKENVIVMERYHFFASSCRQFGFQCKSLSELHNDESETDGALASVLKVLQQVHSSFYDPEHKESLVNLDVRHAGSIENAFTVGTSEITSGNTSKTPMPLTLVLISKLLKTAKKEVLKGCKMMFSHIFPSGFPAEDHRLWKMAEQLGAICCTELDPTVTHVVSSDAGTQKSRWAVRKGKFLVDPKWLEAANYLWRRLPESDYPVSQLNKQKH